MPNGVVSCQAGECRLDDCALGFADCDANLENGCEVDDACEQGATCVTTCGSMGIPTCDDPCAQTCGVPPESCNAADDDCDGACDQGAIAGCRIGVHRAYNGGSGHFYTTDLAEAQAWGLETANFYYLYAGATADLRPFYRCAKPVNGNFLFTDSADCEGTGSPLATLGYIAPAPAGDAPPTCGAAPLYRLRLAASDRHFYTTSAPERDNAVSAGWLDEGIAGYIWTAP